MSDIAIRVENLSKLYRIGELERYKTMRDTLTDGIYAPFRLLRSALQHPSLTSSQPPDGDSTIWALKDVSFEVREGEIIGIIGRNGSGKTTLLKILSRITEPTDGYADIRGRVGSLLEVGTGFHPELSGRENIYLNGAILGMKKAEIDCKFDEIVAFAEIEKFIDTPVKRYSSGMYVRMAFAVAAHLEPEILLVDEVLAVGDAQFQKKCLGKMGTISQQGRTVLFVSHNMTAISNLTQHAIWLDAGRVMQDGPTQTVVSSYLETGTHVSGERQWPELSLAPGNEVTRLQSVRLKDRDGNIRAMYEVQEPITCEIEYWNFVPGAELSVALSLFNQEGIHVLASGTALVPGSHSPLPKGLIRSCVTIPANLLNDGRYFVGLRVLQNVYRSLLLVREVVSFDVCDNGATRGEYLGRVLGVVRPQLTWFTDVVDC